VDWQQKTMKRFALAMLILAAIAPSAHAQLRKIRVVSSDGEPVAYANVIVEGGATQITDDKGEVSLGAGKRQTFSVDVRRIGYTPWFGKLDLPDTAATFTITLPVVAQSLERVRVSGQKRPTSAFVQGFYDRWMMRQKGLLSATFIGPEEIEQRHPGRITSMLNGLHGVNLVRYGHGDMAAYSTTAGSQMTLCPMAIVIDGVQQRPDPPVEYGSVAFINIDRILDANDVMAIEVYARGGNVPISLQVDDMKCGVVAFWTGSRKP
jgi:hypothetical protein